MHGQPPCPVGCTCNKHGEYTGMSLEEIQRQWPSTVRLPPMSDAVLVRFLDDMASLVSRWRNGLEYVDPPTHEMNLRADRLLGIREAQ
jgi:hypothetical protein